MDFATWTPFITVAAAISGILLGWAGRSRAINQDIAQQASADALQRADIEFIKRGVDDIRLDQKAQGKRFDELSERVTRVEESTKQAHKRLDRLDDEN
ncbi:hypothetical protein QIH01_20030 [Brevibacillus brevis]|uniref:hypothetical protein n=1 Tax=Brevibacillus brevis TaxID=1393 RepID=UPI00115B2ACB|nr:MULTISPECIES: hypothetical protein [Bacillales]TQR36611.1 hypothetical protein C7Y45_11980 [Lysinibacillus sp. SDF0063]UIO40339.1 hypothetical protein LOY85_16135 [Brevibacillus brevis]WGV57761.1 hypothetical protein QIH01_20030 [Brevibacillus brevis]